MTIAVLHHIPFWVYPLLIGLTLLGWMQSKSRVIPMWRGLILPVVMTLLSLFALLNSFGSSLPGWPAWIIGFAIPILIALKLTRPESSFAESEPGQVTVPGSWWPLLLIGLVFVARFVVNVALGVDPSLAASFGFGLLTGLTYGALSGAFVVRAMPVIELFRRRLQWPHTKTGHS